MEKQRMAHSVDFQYVYVCISVHNTGKTRGEKDLQRFENDQAGQENVSTLVLLWGDSVKSCSS